MSIIDIKYTDNIPDYAEIDKILGSSELTKMYKMDFCQLTFEVEFSGVHTRYINALQRTLCDELPVPRLYCSILDADFSIQNLSPTMTYNYVIKRIQSIPLVYPWNDKWNSLVLELNITNTTDSNLTITAADFQLTKKSKFKEVPSIFNKSTIIAIIQPGTSLVIRNITIKESNAITDGKFTSVCNTGIKWNLPKEYSLYKNDYNINPFNFDESMIKSVYMCGTFPCVSCDTSKFKDVVVSVIQDAISYILNRLNMYLINNEFISNEMSLKDETNTIVGLVSYELSKLGIDYNWYEIDRKFIFTDSSIDTQKKIITQIINQLKLINVN